MKKVVVSAPGKIHLMGEHAVVHGAPALLSAVNRRLVVSVQAADTLDIQTTEDDTLIREAIRVVVDTFKLSEPSIRITVRSAIPAGRHLGSSAALSVATIGALLYFCKKIWNPELINKLAFEVEKKQHGTPSGGDNSICTYGGFVWFRKELPDLKTIWQLPYSVSDKLAPFHLIDTGTPKETTGDMVARVHAFVEQSPKKAREAFYHNELATKTVATAIKSGDERAFLSAMKRGEQSLESLGVVSKTVQPLIRSIEDAGGAAKILGGGGYAGAVGFILAYHRDKQILEQLAKKHTYSVQDIVLGEEGVELNSGRDTR